MLFYTHSTDGLVKDSIKSLEEYKNRKRKQKTPAVATSMIGHNSREEKVEIKEDVQYKFHQKYQGVWWNGRHACLRNMSRKR